MTTAPTWGSLPTMAHPKKTPGRKAAGGVAPGGSHVALAAFDAPGGTHGRRKAPRADARAKAIRDSYSEILDRVGAYDDDDDCEAVS